MVLVLRGPGPLAVLSNSPTATAAMIWHFRPAADLVGQDWCDLAVVAHNSWGDIAVGLMLGLVSA
jgi:hypothetical protein